MLLDDCAILCLVTWHIHVQKTISNCIQLRLTTRTCVAEKKTFVVATFSVIWKVYAFYSTARVCQWRLKHQLSFFFGGCVVILLQFHTSYQRLGPTKGRRERGRPPPLSFILPRFPFHLTSLPCGAFFLPNTRTLQSPRLQFSRSQTCCRVIQFHAN